MKKIFSGCLLFISCFSLPAQNEDAGLWTDITVEKKISRSSSVYVNESFRFSENISELSTFFTEAGVQKKLLKNLSFTLSYRFINKREPDDSYAQRHRYFADISFRKKIAAMSISFRTRIQSQVENYFLPSEKLYGNTPENYWRNKISLRYQSSKKFKPFIAAEIWYPLNNPKKKLVDNLRCSGGFQYELNKRNTIEISYIIEKELQQKNPATDFITALSYTFAF